MRRRRRHIRRRRRIRITRIMILRRIWIRTRIINKRKNINLRIRRRRRRRRNMRRTQNLLIRIINRIRISLLRITNRRSLLMERCHTCTISLCCIFVFSMLSQQAPASSGFLYHDMLLLMAGSCIIRVPNMYTISGGVRHVISWSELFRLEFLDFFIPMRPH